MIECKPYKTTFLKPYTCINKQTELAEVLKTMKARKPVEPGNGTAAIRTETPPVRYFALKKCHNCQIGLDLYQKYLNGGLTMDVQTKKCPCGVVITREPGQNDMSWSRLKYCQEHVAMNPYQRKKFFEKQVPVEKALETKAPAVKEKMLVEDTFKAKPDSKVCNLDDCGKTFYRKETYTESGWKNKKYCCRNCARKAERIRDNERKRQLRISIAQAKVFDLERATEITENVVAGVLKIVSVFVSDKQTLDQIKAVAVEVGIESQRVAIEA